MIFFLQNAHNLRAQYLRNNSMEEEKFVAKLSSLSKQQESEGITEIAKIGDKVLNVLTFFIDGFSF